MDKSFWFILAFILFIVEILTPGVFFFSAIGIGATVTGIFFLLFPGKNVIGWLIFAVSSVLVVYFVRPIVKKVIVKQPIKSNVDSLIGQKAVVMEKIVPPNMGMIKISGELWRAESDVLINSGEIVEIVAIEGSHLKVKK